MSVIGNTLFLFNKIDISNQKETLLSQVKTIYAHYILKTEDSSW
jgi:hypothetical protein